MDLHLIPFSLRSLGEGGSRLIPYYSYLNASTGFLVAALQLCQLTVSDAIPRAINPAIANIHQLSFSRYAKFSSHLCITYQAMGQAIIKEIVTHLKNVVFSITITSDIRAPFIFRMPISLTRLFMTSNVKPNNPNDEIIMATRDAYPIILPHFSSALYR